MIESTSENGLTVDVNDETSEIIFNWDPETHPEWNFLETYSKDQIIKMLLDFANETIETLEQKEPPTENPMISLPIEETLKKRHLRDALCEYLDDSLVKELIDDMTDIVDREHKRFQREADTYKNFKNLLDEAERWIEF